MSMTKLNQNTTDLQTLAASTGYQEVLDLVNALPDAGGSGDGGAVETCTVTVNTAYGKLVSVTVTQYIDGVMAANSVYRDETTPQILTIDNVLCNSAISVGLNSAPILPGYSLSDDITLLRTQNNAVFWFSAPTTANVNATITIREDD